VPEGLREKERYTSVPWSAMGSIYMKKITIAGGLTAVSVAAFWVSVSTQITPADKVRITGWALNLSNVAVGANQTRAAVAS
jgi:hypothetical protein